MVGRRWEWVELGLNGCCGKGGVDFIVNGWVVGMEGGSVGGGRGWGWEWAELGLNGEAGERERVDSV